MKIIVCIILSLTLLCGCSQKQTAENVREEVIINFPKDNTVNGYRTGSYESSGMPDTIPAESVTINTESSSNSKVLYIGNSNSRVFHLPDCSSAEDTKEQNRVKLKTRQEAVALGYKPCKRCKP